MLILLMILLELPAPLVRTNLIDIYIFVPPFKQSAPSKKNKERQRQRKTTESLPHHNPAAPLPFQRKASPDRALAGYQHTSR
jgi:hypothetical protein